MNKSNKPIFTGLAPININKLRPNTGWLNSANLMKQAGIDVIQFGELAIAVSCEGEKPQEMHLF